MMIHILPLTYRREQLEVIGGGLLSGLLSVLCNFPSLVGGSFCNVIPVSGGGLVSTLCVPAGNLVSVYSPTLPFVWGELVVGVVCAGLPARGGGLVRVVCAGLAALGGGLLRAVCKASSGRTLTPNLQATPGMTAVFI